MLPFTDILAAFRWWLALMLIGSTAVPLTWYLLQRLPDKGYAFTKMVGLLIVSYIFWLSGSLGFTANNPGGIILALILLATLSYGAGRRQPGWRIWIRQNWRYVLVTELVFAFVFALWVWVRAQNPAITATEKPMEFAFLNAIGRSPAFPPHDPWLSGFGISYYYFGYVMTSLLGRLAAVAEPVAFNLGIAWLVAGTAVGAFGLVYNLVAAQSTRRAALTLALIAAIALPIAGNLEIVLEILHGNNIGSAAFWQWLDVRDLNQPPTPGTPPRYTTTNWWWWRSSRVIHEYHLSGRPEDGLEPIAEFPAFSFVLGDMHPHVLALPFAFLGLAVAFVWWREAATWPRAVWPRGWPSWKHPLPHVPLWLFTALVLGGLSFLNTWDVLIHLFVVIGAFFLAQWMRFGWHRELVTKTAVLALLLVIPAILLYLPFYLGFRSQAGPPFLLPMLMRPTRLTHFLIIFGMPLWSVTILLLTLGFQNRFRNWQAGLATAVSLLLILFFLMLLMGWIIATSGNATHIIQNISQELNLSLPPRPETGIAPGWGMQAVFTLLPTILKQRLAYPALTLFLSGLLAIVVMLWQTQAHKTPSETAESTPSHLPFLLLLIATGILLTLGPEFVYLRDNFGMRLNTIFKFYYQSWVLFGVAALVSLDTLWRKIPASAFIATAGYTLAFLLALLFPYYAVNSRAVEYRGPTTAESRTPATLDGLAWLQRFNPDEYNAIMWLRENVSGTPVIVEAVGGQYTGFARVAANTGLPTILGWAGHEYQWRGPDTPEPALRDPAVKQIFGTAEWEETVSLLNIYEVEYIYTGGLELSTYGPQARDKFAGRLPVVYQNNSVTIYRWLPEN